MFTFPLPQIGGLETTRRYEHPADAGFQLPTTDDVPGLPIDVPAPAGVSSGDRHVLAEGRYPVFQDGLDLAGWTWFGEEESLGSGAPQRD